MKKTYKALLVISILFGMQSLSAGGVVVEMTDKNYKEILSSDKPVFVKFWASWCRPCREMTPKYSKVSESYVDKIVFAELNTDKYRSIALSHKVKGIPTTILFKNGIELDRITMSLNKKQIDHWAKEALKPVYLKD